MTMRRFFILAFVMFAVCTPSAYAAREQDEEPSTWEKSRRAYLDKREAYVEKKQEFYHRYRKRVGAGSYRQKARDFYGRKKTLYQYETGNENADLDNSK